MSTKAPSIADNRPAGLTSGVSALGALDNHIRSTHPSLQCKTCNRTLRSLPDLHLHHHKHHRADPTDEAVVDRHAVHHRQVPQVVHAGVVQSRNTTDVPTPQETLDKAGQGTEFQCPLCDVGFSDNSQLKSHLLKHHSITSVYSCQLCETIFLTHVKLGRHLRHDYALLHTACCVICDHIFLNKTKLTRHLDMSHASTQDLTPCSICSKAYPSSGALEHHYQLEHQTPPLECSFHRNQLFTTS